MVLTLVSCRFVSSRAHVFPTKYHVRNITCTDAARRSEEQFSHDVHTIANTMSPRWLDFRLSLRNEKKTLYVGAVDQTTPKAYRTFQYTPHHTSRHRPTDRQALETWAQSQLPFRQIPSPGPHPVSLQKQLPCRLEKQSLPHGAGTQPAGHLVGFEAKRRRRPRLGAQPAGQEDARAVTRTTRTAWPYAATSDAKMF